MPELVGEALAAVGEDIDEWLTLKRLDPTYSARFADGSRIDLRADPEAMADEIAISCGPKDAAGFRRFVKHLAELYRVEMPNFIERNLDSPLQLVGAPLARLVAMGAFRRLGPKVATYVEDERLRRLFSFQAMYAGLAPAKALAIYSVITYMDCVAGVYFPEGGMHAVPHAMATAAATNGVTFRFGTEVSRVEVSGGRASAVITTHGDRIPADVVVVNADLPVAYADLLPPGYTPRRVKRLRYSPSAVVLHAGSSTRYDDAAHHTIDFAASWDDTFGEIIDRGELMSDPSFLLTTPTVTDRSLAPVRPPDVLRPVPDAQPRPPPPQPHRLVVRRAAGTATTSSRRSKRAATRASATASSASTSSRPTTGSPWAWRRGRRSRRRTGSGRPGRSVPRRWTAGSRTWSSAGRTPNPASACRW